MLVDAVGVIGVEGDAFDRVYLGVVAVGVIGAFIAQFNAAKMAIALYATALAQALVVIIALIIGKQHVEVNSVTEIVGLNGFFIALFTGSGLLFKRVAAKSDGL